MAEKPAEPTEPLDVQTIHHLVRLMKRYDLTALDLSEGAAQIRLRRRGPEPPSPAASRRSPAPAARPAARRAAAAGPSPRPPPRPRRQDVVIESPMVGTYYASSAPDAPPFVSVGSAVRPDTTVCIIEAMKVFTDIPAGVSGTIAESWSRTASRSSSASPCSASIPA